MTAMPSAWTVKAAAWERQDVVNLVGEEVVKKVEAGDRAAWINLNKILGWHERRPIIDLDGDPA